MKNRKGFALIISLVLVIGVVLPGTLALSTDQTSSNGTNEVPTETTTPAPDTTEPPVPEGTEATGEPTPAPTEEPEATVEPTPAPTEEPEATPTPTVEPEATVEPTPAPTVEPTETEAPKECTCDHKPAEGEAHKEGCPLYVEPEFDVAIAKEQLLACESIEDVDAFLSSLTEAQADALMKLLTEDEIRALAEKINVNLEVKVVTPPFDYTDVGPLMPAVSVQPSPRLRRAAAKQAEDENGLILSKSAAYDSVTNTVTVTLEAYTTGTVTVSTKSTPVDVVLVLDESGSMKEENIQEFTEVYKPITNKQYYVKSGDSYIQVSWCTGGLLGTHDSGWYSGGHFFIHWGERYEPMTSADDTTSGHVQFYEASDSTATKREALIAAANLFANKVYEDAVANNVDHRMAIIGFSSDNASTIKVGLENDIRNNLSDVTTAINNLNAYGGTYIEDGLTNAESVFANAASTASTERKRVVVIFTDGIPGSGTWNNTTISGSANPAIKSSYNLKNTYGATVYTIGMLNDANPELEVSDQSDDSARTNKFLHYLSSNYPQAQSMTNGGTGSNKGYYLSASDTESLNAIFEKISQEIAVPTIPLDSAAVIKDIIAPSFNVPAEGSISLYTEDYNGTQFVGTRKSASGVTATISGDTISVNGFDYNKYFVSDKKHDETFGKKLIIEFTTTPKDGFLGGNNVFTNGEKSGLYENSSAENALEAFPQPQVNVPIQNVTVTAADKNVYLLGGLTADELKSGATVKVGGVALDLSKASDTTKPWGLEPWQTEYVDITVTVKDKDGNVISDKLENLAEDTTYTVEVTVAPKKPGTSTTEKGDAATAKTGVNDSAANIYVFKPELTFKDSTAYYGETVPTNNNYSGNQVGTEKWMHDGTAAVPSEMLGEKPTLDISFTPDESKLKDGKYTKQDVPVAATVKIGTENVNDYTTFVHQDCTTACGWETPAKPGAPAFLIHIQTCTLTITKQGGADNESYVFDVSKDGEKYSEVTVWGNGTETLVELPIGTYTISENAGWSWRYTANNGSSAELTAQNPTGSITCVNTKNNNQWLNGFSEVVRNIFGTNH